MLDSLPWPNHLKHVPEYAGGHHERMDGTGYPKGLKRDEMSLQARIMGIADIFEALTARDALLPGMKLSQALCILRNLRNNGSHIDTDLFDVFVKQKIYTWSTPSAIWSHRKSMCRMRSGFLRRRDGHFFMTGFGSP